MKKTKLLMPILGVAAVAGTVVPAVVSCGPKAEEKIKLSINNIGILNPTDKVQVVNVKLPEVVADQDYKAEASWKLLDKDGNVLTNCMVDETETFVYDHKNEVITKASFGKPSLSDGTYTMQITVPSSVVDAEGMNFVIGVRQKSNVHQTIESFSYNNGLVGKPAAGGSKTVYGLSSPAFGTLPNWAESNYYFGFDIKLANYDKLLTDNGQPTIKEKNQFVIYIYDISSDSRRTPYSWVAADFAIVNKDNPDTKIKVTVSQRDSGNSALMTLEQNISDEMLKGNYYLVGSFSAYSQIFTEYADAEFCIFSYDQL